MSSANESRRYTVTPTLIGRVHAKNGPYDYAIIYACSKCSAKTEDTECCGVTVIYHMKMWDNPGYDWSVLYIILGSRIKNWI